MTAHLKKRTLERSQSIWKSKNCPKKIIIRLQEYTIF